MVDQTKGIDEDIEDSHLWNIFTSIQEKIGKIFTSIQEKIGKIFTSIQEKIGKIFTNRKEKITLINICGFGLSIEPPSLIVLPVKFFFPNFSFQKCLPVLFDTNKLNKDESETGCDIFRLVKNQIGKIGEYLASFLRPELSELISNYIIKGEANEILINICGFNLNFRSPMIISLLVKLLFPYFSLQNNSPMRSETNKLNKDESETGCDIFRLVKNQIYKIQEYLPSYPLKNLIGYIGENLGYYLLEVYSEQISEVVDSIKKCLNQYNL